MLFGSPFVSFCFVKLAVGLFGDLFFNKKSSLFNEFKLNKSSLLLISNSFILVDEFLLESIEVSLIF
jgi:hypothetical protein